MLGVGGSNTIQGVVQIRGTDQSARSLKSVEKALDDVTRKGLNLGQRMRTVGPQIAVGLAAIGLTAMALQRVADVLGRVAGKVHDLAMAGGQMSAVATAFERIASPGLLQRLQAATGGLVTQQRVMQETTQALRARIMSEDDWVASIGAVTRAAQESGESVDGMVQAFAQMATGGGIEQLGRLGVQFTTLRGRVQAMGLSLESTEGRIQVMRLAAAELRREFGDGSTEISNYNDAVTRFQNALTDYRAEVGRVIAEDQRLVEVVQALEAVMRSAAPESRSLGEAIVELSLTLATAAADAAQLISPLTSLVAIFARLAAAQAAIAGRWDIAGDWWQFAGSATSFGEGAASRAEELGGELRRIRGGSGRRGGGTGQTMLPSDEPSWGEFLDGPGDEPRTWAPGSPTRRRGGGGGRGGASAEAIAARLQEQVRAAAALAEIETEVLRIEKERFETNAEFVREAEAQQMMAEAEEEAAHSQRVKDAEDRARAEQSVLNARRLELEMTQTLAEKERELTRLARERRQENIESAAGAAQAFGQIFDLIAQSEERAGRSSDKWRKAQGVALGIYEAIQAVGQGAKAIGAIASMNPWGAAFHAAAAIQHGVASGMAFSQLAQTGGGAAAAAPAASAGTFVPSMPMDSGGGGGEGNVINIYSWGRSQAAAGRVVSEAAWAAERTGHPVHLPRGVGYAG